MSHSTATSATGPKNFCFTRVHRNCKKEEICAMTRLASNNKTRTKHLLHYNIFTTHYSSEGNDKISMFSAITRMYVKKLR